MSPSSLFCGVVVGVIVLEVSAGLEVLVVVVLGVMGTYSVWVFVSVTVIV